MENYEKPPSEGTATQDTVQKLTTMVPKLIALRAKIVNDLDLQSEDKAAIRLINKIAEIVARLHSSIMKSRDDTIIELPTRKFKFKKHVLAKGRNPIETLPSYTSTKYFPESEKGKEQGGETDSVHSSKSWMKPPLDANMVSLPVYAPVRPKLVEFES